jgi:hypothetical protein
VALPVTPERLNEGTVTEDAALEVFGKRVAKVTAQSASITMRT